MILCKRATLLLVSIFFCLTAVPQGQPSIQRYFTGADLGEFILEEEINRLPGSEKVKGISVAVLEEAVFRTYSRWQIREEGTVTYRLEVFELLDPPGAFQLFSLWPRFSGQDTGQWIRSPIDIRLGQNEITFWKGNFFMRLLPEGNRNGLPLIEELNELIKTEVVHPVTTEYLPDLDRIPDSEKFYLGSASLRYNERFPEPLLSQIGFEDEIEISYAAYEPDDSALFIVGYPTPALADEYFIEMQNELTDFFSSEGVFIKRSGIMVALFIGPEEAAINVLSEVRYDPTIRWIDEKEQTLPEEYLTFFGLLTQTFFGIAVFILITLGAGLVVGLARYEFIQLFPRLQRRKEMVRLKLGEEEDLFSADKPDLAKQRRE